MSKHTVSLKTKATFIVCNPDHFRNSEIELAQAFLQEKNRVEKLRQTVKELRGDIATVHIMRSELEDEVNRLKELVNSMLEEPIVGDPCE